ncbi:putative transposase [Rhodococcus opacus B4]|uniref:Putative transposase n=1 Tax=Rhodococcus opacus (strain B4) TaxID=632772 RepID=C1ASI5_RHOOB|nr:putative transposase [Rhodococcus opacus B4]
MRRFGVVPTYALTDNPRTASIDHVAGIAVRRPQIVETGRHCGVRDLVDPPDGTQPVGMVRTARWGWRRRGCRLAHHLVTVGGDSSDSASMTACAHRA